MYNKGTVLIGLAIFVILVTFPIWINGVTSGTDMPDPIIAPEAGTECVYPKAEMRDKHMFVLDEWRDEVLREGDRSEVVIGGKKFRKGLQMACLSCHVNKEEFCDTCHEYASVKPYCWDCHLSPTEQATKKEVK